MARQTVYTWKDLLDEGGIDALRAVPPRGRPGWTHHSLKGCAVPYCEAPPNMALAPNSGHSSGWGRLSGACMGSNLVQPSFGGFSARWFSVQKPEKRALERDEDVVRQWKRRTWPALKKKPGGKAG